MKSVNVKDGLPDKPGNYWCTIEAESYVTEGKIHQLKQVCWFMENGKFNTEFSNQKVISWVDESEPDQDILWGEVKEIIWHGSLHAYLSTEAIEKLKPLYTLIRK